MTCPRCGHGETSFVSTRKIWKCKGCKKQFSLKVGTIFEDSPLENYWSLLKRSIKGSQIHVSPAHLDRYVTERTFAYNHAWAMIWAVCGPLWAEPLVGVSPGRS